MEHLRNLKQQVQNKFQTMINGILQFSRTKRTFLVEFCNNSSIHGLRYFTERFLHWSERLFWLIAVCVSLWFCGSLVKGIWIKWQENPVTMSFTEKPILISSIPAPTITICTEIKIDKRKFDLSSAISHSSNLSKIEKKRLNALAHICPTLPEIVKFEENFTDESIYETISDIAPHYNYTFDFCRIIPQGDGCNEIIKPIFTDDGLCYTLNALNSRYIYTNEMAPDMMILKTNPNVSNWSLERDIKNTVTFENYKQAFPIHTISVGIYSFVHIKAHMYPSSHEYKCQGIDQGIKVILTTPGDVPKMSRNSIRVPVMKETRIAIKSKLTTTSEGLRDYDPNRRQCFFESERQLHFFRIYSKSNCEEECLSNFTKTECGCVKFSMPRNRNTKICGGAKIKCYKMAGKKLSSSTGTQLFRDTCNCLPACTSIEFITQINRADTNFADFVTKAYGVNIKILDNYYDLMEMFIFFKDLQVERVKRIEVYTFSDFLAIFGALLGLFLGISLLSIVEIVYYSTLRLFWSIRLSRCQIASEPIEQTSNENNENNSKFIWTMKVFFTDLCDKSNIHGLRYFTERILHWSERLWWIIGVGVSLWLCGSMIQNIWQQWQENPVTMIFTENSVPISTIPFPTVTICPNTKAIKQKINITKPEFFTLSEIQTARANAIINICLNWNTLLERKKEYAQYVDETIYDTIQDIAPKLDDVMHACWWQGQKDHCSKYFTPILTDEGLCFTFNALNSHEIYTDEMAPGMMTVNTNPNVSHWSLENEYESGFNTKEYPIRVIDSGQDAALDVDLVLDYQDFVDWCNGIDHGFKLILTSPGNALQMSDSTFRVPISEYSQVNMNPKLTTTSEGLRNYKPHQRQCFFQFERRLRFFKNYTEKNCEAECATNFTFAECGCVKFSMPRNSNMKVCGIGNRRCAEYVALLSKMIIKSEIFDKCNCLPSCNSIEYNANIDQVQFDMEAIRAVSRLNANKSSILLAKLSIFFGDQNLGTVKRVETYTFSNFLAICGGLLGLYIGVSTLSIIELIYYLTLRFFWTVKGLRSGPMSN